MIYDIQKLLDPNFKSKWQHPYDYDPFTIFRHTSEVGEHTIYTDRMYQWDYKKFDASCFKHFGNAGQYFDNRKPELIEKFLSDYLGKEVILCEIIEYCNQATGYPTWRLDYKEISNDV